MNQLNYTAKRVTRKGDEATANTHKLDRFNLLLYVDTEDYCTESVLEKVRTNDHIGSYAYILHDRDFYTEETFDRHGNLLGHIGEMKKAHYHVTVSLNSRYTISDIGLWLGIPQRFIEKCKSFDGSILYLTHRNAPEKVPYNNDEIVTNIKPYTEYLYNNYQPKDAPIKLLWQYLESNDYPTISGFVRYVGDDRVPELVKYWSMIRSILDENKSGYLEKVEVMSSVKQDNIRYMTAIKDLCNKFGSVTVDEIDEKGKPYQVQYTLNENGDIDLLGFTEGGNK